MLDTRALSDQVARLKAARLVARDRVSAKAREQFVYVGTIKQVWNLCVDDEQRHEILAGQIQTLLISRATPGCGHFDSSRVHLTWSDNPKPTVPDVISVGPIQRRMREPTPWISIRDASRLIGSSDSLVHRGIRTGQIKQRKVNRMYPSLDRESVMAYIRDQAAERRKYDTPAWISRSNAFRLFGNAQLIRRGIKTGQITQRHVGHNYPSLERTSVMAYIREHDAELPPNEPGAWISRHQAYQLTGKVRLIRRGIKTGQITQRHVGHNYPSLERASVMAFVRDQREATTFEDHGSSS